MLPFLGVFEIDRETYMVSPWVDRGDLAAFMAGRRRFFQLPADSVERVYHPQGEVYSKFNVCDIVSERYQRIYSHPRTDYPLSDIGNGCRS